MSKTMIEGFLLLAGSLLATPLLAQSTVNERHPLAGGGRVEIENVAGELRVRGWDRDEVELTGSLGEGQRLDVQSSRNRVQMRVVYPQGRRSGEGARLELRVPRGAELQASTVSAPIDIAEVELARVQAQAVSGSIKAQGRARESQLGTVSGGIQSRLTTPRLRVETVSGRIAVTEGASGDIGMETVSGQINATTAAVSRLRANTVSGSINVSSSALGAGGSIALESVSGSISLDLPRNTSARLKVNTFSGDIDSDAGEVQRPRYGPGRSLDAQLGSGNGDVTIESHSGSVRVQRGG
ncbi:MAG TPA: hypothetical protein DDZ67_09855 [Xanthomonadaceae bacterium]|nr:hypothetical protein [Xanthomonadaceae bacterium]